MLPCVEHSLQLIYTMEQVHFDYATKNIPLKEYQSKLIEKTEHLCRRMRWKALFFLNPELRSTNNTYRFNSKRTPPQIHEMVLFENRLLDLIKKGETKT